MTQGELKAILDKVPTPTASAAEMRAASECLKDLLVQMWRVSMAANDRLLQLVESGGRGATDEEVVMIAAICSGQNLLLILDGAMDRKQKAKARVESN